MPAAYQRHIEIRAAVADDGGIELVASTDAPLEMRGWFERLSHGPGAIDHGACRSLLVNHDANQIVGRVDEIRSDGRTLVVRATVSPDAKLQSGVNVRDAIKQGMLRGVSIGYSYGNDDVEYEEASRTLTVKRWRLLEATLTPIPADAAAHVRSLPESINRSISEPPKVIATMSEPVKQEPATVAGPDPLTIARHAEDLGLRASDYLGKGDALTLMLADAAKARAANQKVVDPVVQVTADEGDKIRAQAVDGLLSGHSSLKVISTFAGRSGVETRGWDKGDAAEFVFPAHRGALHGRAAEVSANFSQVTALAGNKAMKDAYDKYLPVWNLIADSQTTGDFKTVRTAALQFGDLAAVAEGAAATDITVDDAGGSGALTYRGRILELTKEAIYNDELGIFFKRLSQIGQIGGRHVDKSVFAALEAAAFTNATAALALSQANLATAWTNHMAITGPAGEKRAVTPQRLVVPSALYVTAKEITTLAQGETTARVFAAGEDYIRPVHGMFLTDANDWYLLADPAVAPCLTVVFHSDYPAPRMFEIDSGATISRKFRIEFPLAVISNTEGTGKPMGGYKATQP